MSVTRKKNIEGHIFPRTKTSLEADAFIYGWREDRGGRGERKRRLKQVALSPSPKNIAWGQELITNYIEDILKARHLSSRMTRLFNFPLQVDQVHGRHEWEQH